MNKISFKLGFLFFSFILLVELILFYFLYTGLVNTRIDDEISELQARGNSHRNVLEKHYDQATLNHVALMESEADTDVVIISIDGEVLEASRELIPSMEEVINTSKLEVPLEGMVVENRWKTELHISTVSPIFVQEKLTGYVYMFKSTASIQKLISRLNHHFILVGGLAFLVTIIAIFFLSKVLTIPLIRMKQATEKLSKGDFSVSLEVNKKDELGDLSRSIQALAKDLQHLRDERNEFLASIAHELRTPLTYVKGYADIAKRESLSSEERNKYLSIIVEEVDRISRLVKDLFDLAKIDQNTFHITKEKVELCRLLHHIKGKIQSAFIEKEIELILTCNKGIYIMIDPARFEQVMVNLLENARKYSEPKSTVRILVEEKGQHVGISIKDQGSGIPEGDIPFIFHSFYRVDKSRSRESGGTGLGLAIVKEIVEKHGGVITVKSSLNQGTTFTIQLRKEAKL